MKDHNGNANKMVGDTPRTKKFIAESPLRLWPDFARQLERELNAANERIKRLEEAGDKMATWLSSSRNLGGDPFMSHQWRKAKEAKP